MAAETTKESVTLEDLMMSTGAMADAALKQLIGNGVLIDAKFKAKLDSEQTSYLAVLERRNDILPWGVDSPDLRLPSISSKTGRSSSRKTTRPK